MIHFKKPRHPLPVRLLHWTYVPAILTLAWSGFYISNPSGRWGFSSMNSARKTHFVAQFILISSYLYRLYYGTVNKNYKEIIPDQQAVKELPRFLKYEFFLTKKKPRYKKYNPGQKFVFTGMALQWAVQIISGLGLYWPKAGQKISLPAGGLNPLRKLHYLNALFTLFLAGVHFYFVLTNDPAKIKSIFTGHE